jgi:hypothetical protein
MALEIVNNHKPPTKDEVKGRLIFGSIGIVLGLAILIFASIPMSKKAKETKSWVEVPAEISNISVIAHKDGLDRMKRDNPKFYVGDEDIKFRVDIEYTYLVDGAEYSSSKKHLMQNKNEGSSSLRKAYCKADWYDEHPHVLAYYNPENPQEALLQKGLRFGQTLLVYSPLLMFLFGIWALFSGIKNTIFPASTSTKKPKTFSDNFSKQA